MPPPRRGRLERTAAVQPQGFAGRRHVLSRPATAAELDEQLREIVPHHPQCVWQTRPIFRREGMTLTQIEAARCTCTAVHDRQHLRDVIASAAAGQLPAQVLTQ